MYAHVSCVHVCTWNNEFSGLNKAMNDKVVAEYQNVCTWNNESAGLNKFMNDKVVVKYHCSFFQR